MASKNKSNKCVHCLGFKDDITMDHVFPSFWYPSNTSQRVQRAKVPSCFECNNRLGAIEQEVGILMWACIDPNKPEVQGLRQKVMQYFGIGVSGLSKGEKEKRENLRMKFVENMEPYALNPKFISYPGFGPHKSFPLVEQKTIKIPTDKLFVVAEKVVRGLEYRQKGLKRYVEDPYKLEIFPAVRESELPSVVSMINQLPINQHGPGFEIRRGVTSDGEEILYRIEFWGTWVVYGFVSKRAIPRSVKMVN